MILLLEVLKILLQEVTFVICIQEVNFIDLHIQEVNFELELCRK